MFLYYKKSIKLFSFLMILTTILFLIFETFFILIGGVIVAFGVLFFVSQKGSRCPNCGVKCGDKLYEAYGGRRKFTSIFCEKLFDPKATGFTCPDCGVDLN